MSDFYYKISYERKPISDEKGIKIDWFSYPLNTECTIEDATAFIKAFIPSATGNKVSIEKKFKK